MANFASATKENNNKTHSNMNTTSTFNFDSIAKVYAMANAIAKVHATYNEYAIAEKAADVFEYSTDPYEWCRLYDAETKAAKGFRAAVRTFAKLAGLDSIRSYFDFRGTLTAKSSAYEWAKTYNDIISEYGHINTVSFEIRNIINEVQKMSDYTCALAL